MSKVLNLEDEEPSTRADVYPMRENAGLGIDLKLGPFGGKGEVNAQVQATSPTGIAIAVLVLTVAGCFAAAVLGALNLLLRAPGTLMAVFCALAFFGVIGTGIGLIHRFLPAGRGTEGDQLRFAELRADGNGDGSRPERERVARRLGGLVRQRRR